MTTAPIPHDPLVDIAIERVMKRRKGHWAVKGFHARFMGAVLVELGKLREARENGETPNP